MANTVSLLAYANTFGDWVVTTNALALENNVLAQGNYNKNAGTLFLNSSNLGLQVGNNAVIQGQLQVQGVGSSAYVQNGLTVDGTINLANTTISLLAAGRANVAGPIYANYVGKGLEVKHSAEIGTNLDVGSDLTVGGQTTLTGVLESYENSIFNKNITVLKDVSSNNIIVNNKITGNSIVSNTSISCISLDSTNINTSNNIVSNTIWVADSVNTPTIKAKDVILTGNVYAQDTVGYFGSIQSTGKITVGGDFIINGTTVYNTNTFTISAGSSNQISTLSAYRVGANAAIRWNEPVKYWDIINVDTGVYSRILTTELISDSVSTISSITPSSATAANTLNNRISATFNRANTSSNTFVGTVGSAVPTSQSITFSSNNGVIISGASNTLTISTSQDLRTSAAPTFNGITLNGLSVGQTVATTSNNTQLATTAYVQNNLNSGNTFTMSVTGNSGTATTLQTARNINGVSFNGSADITVTANASTLSGTSLNSSVVNSSLTSVGTLTNLTVTNIINGSINGNANTVSYGVYTNTVYNDPSWINISASKVGLGTTSNTQFASLGVGTPASSYPGEIRAAYNITAYYSSDKRLKENIKNISNPLEKVSKLNGVEFDWNDDYIQKHGGEDGYFIRKHDIGLIAQEMEEVLPELVVDREDGYKAVKYDRVVALLIESVKELKQQNETLSQEIEKLKNQ